MKRSKSNVAFACENCGSDSPKWEGRCPACGEWNTLVEVSREKQGIRDGSWLGKAAPETRELSRVSTDDQPRMILESAEVNRVLGGGIVPGSLTLIAGDPGIGKSTLLLGLASDVAEHGGPALYVTGEESAAQVKLRADRLGISGSGVHLLESTDVSQVIRQIESHKPALVVVDSIQTMDDGRLDASPGSVTQIRECTRALMGWAKCHDVPVILAGHVTKGGDIAGPRVLEHMVDVVLYMEGEPVSAWRLLRTVKNRFGSTNEVGIFEMTERGLVEVEDPSRVFLSEYSHSAIGSVIVSTMEGSRPLLAEVQALTSQSVLPVPRRVASGIDFNRLLLVCAVLSRRASLSLASQDVVVNVTGGLRIGETAADLAVALAIASSLNNTPVEPKAAVIGEVGLSGEIRAAPQIERRIAEAARLGLGRCLVPAAAGQSLRRQGGMEVVPVATLAQAVRVSLAGGRDAAAVLV